MIDTDRKDWYQRSNMDLRCAPLDAPPFESRLPLVYASNNLHRLLHRISSTPHAYSRTGSMSCTFAQGRAAHCFSFSFTSAIHCAERSMLFEVW